MHRHAETCDQSVHIIFNDIVNLPTWLILAKYHEIDFATKSIHTAGVCEKI